MTLKRRNRRKEKMIIGRKRMKEILLINEYYLMSIEIGGILRKYFFSKKIVSFSHCRTIISNQ
jgi:hypothetical protein